MKYKMFDVVELRNGNRATILSEDKNIYKVEIVDSNGISLGFHEIEEKDIKKVIFSK